MIDYAKIATYLMSVLSGVMGVLLATHNVSDGQSQTIITIGSVVTSAIATIAASHTGAKK